MVALWALAAGWAALDPSPHSEASLVAAVEAFAPGRPFDVAVRIAPDPGWYFYWRNPGDNGMPVEVDWRLPEGWRAEPIAWPSPRRFDSDGFASFGFDAPTLLPVRLTPPASWRAGDAVDLRAEVTWMVCQKACVPAAQSVGLRLGSGPAARPGPRAGAIAEALRSAPVPKAGARFSVGSDGFTVDFAWSPGTAGTPVGWDFFAAEPETIDHARPIVAVERTPTGWRLHLRRSEFAPATPPARLRGVAVPLDAEGRRLAPGYDLDAVPISAPSEGENQP